MDILLCKNSKYKRYYVHRLVAQAFLKLDMSNKMMCVCHKNDDPTNNNVNNLFLWTHKDNNRDMHNKWRSISQKRKRDFIHKNACNVEEFDNYDNHNDSFIVY